MKNRDICWGRYKKQCTQDNDAWVPFKVGTLGPHTILSSTISCPIVFNWISWMVWNLFSFKDDFSFWEKKKVAGCQIRALRGMNHLGDLMFCQKNSAWDMMHEDIRCCDEAANHELPIAAVSWIIPIVSMEDNSDAELLLYSVILNAMATKYICSLNSIYGPQWLV